VAEALTLADAERRISAIGELQGLVNAMRTLAAARVQQAQASLPALRAYAEVVRGALAEGVSLLGAAGPPPPPAPRGPTALVLFCAEHGFAGAFSRRVLEAALPPGGPPPILLLVGSRGLAAADERGLQPAFRLPMATQAAAVMATARQVADELYRRWSTGSLGRVTMLFSRHGAATPPPVERHPLLPLPLAAFHDPHRRRLPPLVHLEPAHLLERLVEEYVFALLAHAAMESFASENAARLATLQAARDSIDRALEDLRSVERRLRQEQVTAEILELVTGAATSVQ
jgi:F-type H+-transporting ATPase subunit gamma